MNEPVDEMDLERYLQRRDPLSRAYDELRDEMPSDKVNRAVLQAARNATSADTRPRNPWNAFWLRRAALAATLVLCVAVVLQINVKKNGEVIPTATADKQDAAAPEPYPVQLIAPAAQQAPNEAESAATPAAETPQVGGGTSSARMSRPVEAPAAAPMPASPEQTYEAQRSVPAPASVEVDTPVAEEKSANGRMDSVSRRESAATQEAESRPAMNRMSKVLKEAAPGNAETLSVRDPEEWLKAIEALRAAGDVAAAEKEMERFRAAYPHYLETRTVAPTK